MKKSTLITTIAMIVVVVVALSTATYAWFSTSTQSIATTTITTQSSTDWTIQQGKIPATLADADTQAITFTSGGDNIQLNGAMNAGLWSPSKAIALYTKDQNAVSNNLTTASLVTWFTAKHDTGKDASWLTAKYEPTKGVKYNYYPDILRVVNSKRESDIETSKNLLCNVVVSLGASPSDGTKYAAAATVFYLGVNNGTTTTAYTNGYGVANGTLPNASAEYAEGSVVTKGTAVEATVTGKPTYSSALTSLGSNHKTVQDPQDGLEKQCNLTIGTEYLLYTIDLGPVAYAQGVTIVLYTWLDGWEAGDEAVGSSLNITYLFSTGTINKAPAQGEAGSVQG